MTSPKNRRAQGCNPELNSKDQSPLTDPIKSNSTHEPIARLLFAEFGIQYAQLQFEELAQYTDQPGLGVVEAADAVDVAARVLAKARGLS
jgi:hypothetical protein